MDILKNLLGDNAEEKLKAVMEGLGGSSSGDEGEEVSLSDKNSAQQPDISRLLGGINADYIGRIRDMVEHMPDSGDDPRANLLLSLKPYMRDTRRRSIDSAVKLLSISRIGGLLRNSK